MRGKWLMLGALLLTCCRQGGKEPAKEDDDDEHRPKQIRVRCGSVRGQTVQDRIQLHGTVGPLPDRDALVSPQAAGRLLKVLVREGDAVVEGQPIAQIETGPIADQFREADALYLKAQAESKNAQATLERVQDLVQHGIAARQAVEDATARAAAARATEAQSMAASRRAGRQLEFATARSPLNGVVLRVFRHSGELVDGTPATPIVEVGDPAVLELLAEAPPQDLVQLGRGNAATLSFGALPGRSFSGSVAAVAPAVDRATGLGKVRIALALSRGPAPPVGLYGTAWVAVGPPRPGLLIPLPALRSRSGQEAEIVQCGSDGKAQVRRIRIGLAFAGPTEVEVSGELHPGDRVAVDPVLGISDGDKLEVSEPGPASAADAVDGGAHD